MANGRTIVAAPTKRGLAYGLLSVAESRTGTSNRWQAGVTWQNVCPDAASTYEACVLGNAFGQPVTGIAAAPAKAATAVRSVWGATPFTVLVEIDCSPPGFWEDADALVEKAFDEAEGTEVEEVFFTGTVAGTPNFQFPHLASAGTLEDDIPGGATLQLSAASLAPSGNSSLDVVEALGRLDRALSACVKGEGVIHVSTDLVAHMLANHLLREEDGILYSPGGHRVAVGSGYSGASPSGALQVGVSWMYGTGPVFVYKSRARFVGDKAASLDRTVDTLKRIYERTYVLGYDCCLFAVPVSTGGVITGTINAAT